jgi:hypothetical protein
MGAELQFYNLSASQLSMLVSFKRRKKMVDGDAPNNKPMQENAPTKES